MDIRGRSDEELIDDVKSGSAESFRVLYERYRTKIFNYAYHFLGDRAAAEDCMQDVFLQVYKKADSYGSRAKFSSWLYRIARNMALDALRKKKVRRAETLDAPLGDAGSESVQTLKELVASPGAGPDRTAQSEELKTLLRQALLKLGEKDRQVIILCDLQGLSHEDAGQILGYPPNTVTVKLYRARRRLAELLGLDKDEIR